MALTPHGFNTETLPWISLTPYLGGASGMSSTSEASTQVKKLVDGLKGAIKNKKPIGETLHEINAQYYGDYLFEAGKIYIPITESFKISAENEFESMDPTSPLAGAFGGVGSMVGANIMGINNVIGKAWAGSTIGIGNFSFSVAVDTTEHMESVDKAIDQNKSYVKWLQQLFFVSRQSKDIGVLKPPMFCRLDSSWDFSRQYVGVKSLNVETLGMWSNSKLPIAYNLSIEVEDCVLAVDAPPITTPK